MILKLVIPKSAASIILGPRGAPCPVYRSKLYTLWSRCHLRKVFRTWPRRPAAGSTWVSASKASRTVIFGNLPTTIWPVAKTPGATFGDLWGRKCPQNWGLQRFGAAAARSALRGAVPQFCHVHLEFRRNISFLMFATEKYGILHMIFVQVISVHVREITGFLVAPFCSWSPSNRPTSPRVYAGKTVAPMYSACLKSQNLIQANMNLVYTQEVPLGSWTGVTWTDHAVWVWVKFLWRQQKVGQAEKKVRRGSARCFWIYWCWIYCQWIAQACCCWCLVNFDWFSFQKFSWLVAAINLGRGWKQRMVKWDIKLVLNVYSCWSQEISTATWGKTSTSESGSSIVVASWCEGNNRQLAALK